MKSDLFNKLNSILGQYSRTEPLLKEIMNCGEVLLIGGVLREYKDNKLESSKPRDIDIVVDTDDRLLAAVLSPYKPKRNRFDGYKIICNDLIIDLWCLKNTWAFKENKIKCEREEYSSRLQDTVFLNLDSIVYNLSQDIWYDNKYLEAMKTKTLDIILEENPQIALNIIRSVLFKNKYALHLSDKLVNIICNFVYNSSDYIDELIQAQVSHYKYTILDRSILDHEITSICKSNDCRNGKVIF